MRNLKICIKRDGRMEGYAFALIEAVVNLIKALVITSGAAGTYRYMMQAIRACGASVVTAVRFFFFIERAPVAIAAVLAEVETPVRESFFARLEA